MPHLPEPSPSEPLPTRSLTPRMESSGTGPADQDWLQLNSGTLQTTPEPDATVPGPIQVARRSSFLRKAELSPLPDRIAHYQILSELGRGGMGVVYQALDTRLQREVALKIIQAGSTASGSQRTRFHTEAETAARLQHPNIVQVHEIGEWEGKPYLAMELVEGESLQALLSGQPQSPQLAAQWVALLAQAMHYAHQQGVIHRDLKPANILRAASGLLKITDFGLAKSLEGSDQHTRTGDVVGTPQYMAPEQASGTFKQISAAADVYSLGVILYEMLTGRPPFRGATALDTLLLVRMQEPVPPSHLQPKVPPDLETICLKCLHKEPDRRYASAAELAADLQRFLGHQPILARRVGFGERVGKWVRRHPAGAGLLGVSLLALLALAGIGLFVLANASLTTQLHTARRQQQEAVAKEFESVTDDCLDRLEDACDLNLEVLYSLAAFHDARPQMTSEEFHRFAGRALERHAFLLALQWVPQVSHSQRPAWEQRMVQQGLVVPYFWERDNAGKLLRAGERKEYHPIQYLEPPQPVATFHGYDHGSEITRRTALQKAIETGQPTATAMTGLCGTSATGPERCFLIYLAVYQQPGTPPTAKQRHEQLVGHVIVACDIRKLIRIVFQQSFEQLKFDLVIWDETDPAEPQLVYPENGHGSSGGHRHAPEGHLSSERFVKFAGRTWRVICHRPQN